MSAEGKFLIFCLEIYKTAKKLTGKQVMALFQRYGITEYVLACYEALHTIGTNYIIEDIDLFIQARQEES